MKAPKVFVSHASEDKDRFVLPLARALRSQGVDAWLDAWEMHGGDSLVQRIFDEGISDADAVVVVVSANSVSKPWVREELDAAVVHRIENATRLIPVQLDGVDMPAPIRHLLRYDAEKEAPEDIATRIRRTLYGETAKPPLGPAPEYVSRRPASLPDPLDDFVFSAIVDQLRDAPPNAILFTDEIATAAAAQGIGIEDFVESMTALVDQYRIVAQPMLSRTRWQITGVPDRVWLGIEQNRGVDLDSARERILAAAVNGDDVNALVGDEIHWRTLRALLAELTSKRFLSWVAVLDGGVIVQSVSPLARRALREVR